MLVTPSIYLFMYINAHICAGPPAINLSVMTTLHGMNQDEMVRWNSRTSTCYYLHLYLYVLLHLLKLHKLAAERCYY